MELPTTVFPVSRYESHAVPSQDQARRHSRLPELALSLSMLTGACSTAPPPAKTIGSEAIEWFAESAVEQGSEPVEAVEPTIGTSQPEQEYSPDLLESVPIPEGFTAEYPFEGGMHMSGRYEDSDVNVMVVDFNHPDAFVSVSPGTELRHIGDHAEEIQAENAFSGNGGFFGADCGPKFLCGPSRSSSDTAQETFGADNSFANAMVEFDWDMTASFEQMFHSSPPGKDSLDVMTGRMTVVHKRRQDLDGEDHAEEIHANGPLGSDTSESMVEPNPRTLYATDSTGKLFYLITVDGRSVRSKIVDGARSAGITAYQTSELALFLGVDYAAMFDGGGSTAAEERIGGERTVINVPSDRRRLGNQITFGTDERLADLRRQLGELVRRGMSLLDLNS